MQAVAPHSLPLSAPRHLQRGGRASRLASVAALDAAGILALAGLTVVSRLAIQTQYLFNWDSIQFALGVQRFDVTAHRPHPPGYLGYIFLGRLATGLSGGNPEAGLVLLSALAEALAVVLAFVAARRLWGRFAGWSAAILLFTSPLFWFYGGTALSYALEPAVSLAVLWAAYRASRGDRRALLAGAFAVGLAGAIRPTDEVFLALPLAWAAWRTWQRAGIRPLLGAAALITVTSLAWLVPLMVMSGGPARYLLASRELSAKASDTSAIWKTGLSGLQLNGDAVLAGLVMALGLLAPLLLTYALVRRLPGVSRELRHLPAFDRDYSIVTAALLLPTVGVYLLVHIGQLGYILLLLPALVLPAGVVLDGLARAVAGARAREVKVALLGVCALANAATFALPQGGLHDQLVQHDAYVQSLISTIRGYDPATTVLLTSAEANGSYRLAQFYLPAYPVIALGKDQHKHAGEMFSTTGAAPEYDLARFTHAGTLVLPAGARTVVVLDRDAAAMIGDRGLLNPVLYGDEWRLWTMPLDGPSQPAQSGAWVYLAGADCPCHGAGSSTPVHVSHQPF